MLLFCEVGDENAFFDKVWRLLIDDIQYQLRDVLGDRSYHMPDDDARDCLLHELAALFSRSGCNIRDFNLPQRTSQLDFPRTNRLIEEELAYSSRQLSDDVGLVATLNPGQLRAFSSIVDAVLNNRPGFFFVSRYGGTGKTYLWRCIVAHLRAQRKIVLTVASSGVASILLPRGRTAHSRFKIPCDLDDSSVCDIRRGTMLAELIQRTSLIIWDEALMTNKKAFEAVDRTLHDIQSARCQEASAYPFGGIVVVLGGDVRQILPVIEGGNRAKVVNSAIINSALWSSVPVLHLTENMRLNSCGLEPTACQQLAQFSTWMLDVEEGKVPCRAREGEDEPSWIKIPPDLLLITDREKIPCIVDAVYPSFLHNYRSDTYLKERAILTPTNELAEAVNDYIVSLLLGIVEEYLSSDCISKSAGGHESYKLLYPVEFLNSLNGNNFPQHT